MGRSTVADECECLIEKRVKSRIPLRFQQASLIDFSPSIENFAGNWLAKPTDGLLITGDVGRGKTHLAAAMVRTLLLVRKRSIRFEKFAAFYARLREVYRANLPEEDAWEDLGKVEFLFLDDLGAGSLSDHERRATLDLIDRRMDTQLVTCITTNWSLQEIARKMDERIASRLQCFDLVRLDGNDRRGEFI